MGETPPVPTSAPTAHPQADVPAAPSAPVAAARTSVAAGTSAAAGASSSHETQLAERAARLAVQRQKDAEEAKEAARRRKEKGKAKADPDSEGGEGSLAGKPKAEARKAAQQLRQRQQEAAQERQRILRQIEHDRAERKARDERRRAERLAVEAEPQEDGGEDAPDATSAPGRATLNRHEFCSLQVRLFDGSNIRTRLPCGNNIRQDVRSWVDETRDDGRTPYTFRVIYPNRLIEETEEDKTLAELGLTPSATLVLVPVEKYATAYEDGDAGRLQRLVAFLRHLVHMIITFFTSIFSSPARPEEQAPPAQRQRQPLRQGETAAEAVQGRSSQIKGRRNANNAQRDYQLYNGNSVSGLGSLNMATCLLTINSSTSSRGRTMRRTMLLSMTTIGQDIPCSSRWSGNAGIGSLLYRDRRTHATIHDLVVVFFFSRCPPPCNKPGQAMIDGGKVPADGLFLRPVPGVRHITPLCTTHRS